MAEGCKLYKHCCLALQHATTTTRITAALITALKKYDSQDNIFNYLRTSLIELADSSREKVLKIELLGGYEHMNDFFQNPYPFLWRPSHQKGLPHLS